MLPEFSTSMMMGPGGTAESDGEKRCPSYLTRKCGGVVVGSPATGNMNAACITLRPVPNGRSDLGYSQSL